MPSSDDVLKELEKTLEDLSAYGGPIGEASREALASLKINRDKIKSLIEEALKEIDPRKRLEKILLGSKDLIKLSEPNVDLKYLVLGIAIIEALLTSKAVQLQYT
jgi:hypothetical protein